MNHLTIVMQYLSRNPIFGITGSLISIPLTQLQVLQVIGAVLAIIIAVITAAIKIIELREKLFDKKESPPAKPIKKVIKKKRPLIDEYE